MNRNYTAEEYLRAIRNIRENIADIAITTDLMVGFPGETEEHFRQSLQLAREAGFAKIHVFNFSARPGTPAARMAGQISSESRSRRSREALELNEILMHEYRERFLKRRLEVLVEEKKGEHLVGLTDNYLRVAFPSRQELIGELVGVELLEMGGNLIFGKVTQRVGC
jgi:threonylcarbamoyladenosine tRNA methylthiotransferase MtaB